MVAKGHIRGHPVFYIDNEWRYSNDKIVNKDAICARCGKLPTSEGYDACLGYIPNVISACCGHGVEPPYIIQASYSRNKED